MEPRNAKIEILIDGCRNNSWQHREALYKQYYGYVKGVVIRYTHDYHVAEELVNDSFLKIFSNLAFFNPSGQNTDLHLSFKSWMGKIASRTAIDFLRKKKADFTEVSENHAVSNDTAGNPGTEVQEILRLVNGLPEVQRTVFNLYEIEGFSHEEIARLLNINENVSRVYLSRAKEKLKKLYTTYILNKS